MSSALPHFRFIKDPMQADSFFKEACQCVCCGEMVDSTYFGPVFSPTEDHPPEDFCADCIVSGQAHERFNVTFNDPQTQLPQDARESIPYATIKEFAERSPGLCGEEKLEWPIHCGDICTLTDVSNDLKQYKRLPLLEKETLEPYETVKHFTFKCNHCEEVIYKGYKTYDHNLSFHSEDISALLKALLQNPSRFSDHIDIQCSEKTIRILKGLHEVMDAGYQSLFDARATHATRPEILAELKAIYSVIEDRFYTDTENPLQKITSLEEDILKFRKLYFYVLSDCIIADKDDLEALAYIQDMWRRKREDKDEAKTFPLIRNILHATKKLREKHGLRPSPVNVASLKADVLTHRR